MTIIAEKWDQTTDNRHGFSAVAESFHLIYQPQGGGGGLARVAWIFNSSKAAPIAHQL